MVGVDMGRYSTWFGLRGQPDRSIPRLDASGVHARFNYVTLQAMADEPRQYFTVNQVNALLPQVIESFDVLVQVRLQILQIQAELARYGADGPDVDFENVAPLMRGRVRSLLTTLDLMIGAFRKQAENVEATGCEIKGMDPPLADWYAMHEGEEVLLCWKYGERAITHWHDLYGGFMARRPIAELDGAPSSAPTDAEK